MISLLCPTRGRPASIRRFVESAAWTAANPLEFVFYVDADDHSGSKETVEQLATEGYNTLYVEGPRVVLSEMWNRCYEVAPGPIFGHMGDDIIFRTQDWDLKVLEAFDAVPDKILFVHGEDGNPWDPNFGTHGFIHKNWVDVVGYFVPPYFSSDYNDTVLNYIAVKLGRRQKIDIYTEHMHYAFGKSELDATYRERLERHNRDNPGAIYNEKIPEFDQKAADLQKFIEEYQR